MRNCSGRGVGGARGSGIRPLPAARHGKVRPLRALKAVRAEARPPPAMPVGSQRGLCAARGAADILCRSWDDLAAKLVWARQEGYRTAKARRANGYVDRPLMPSEQMRLVDAPRGSRSASRVETKGTARSGSGTRGALPPRSGLAGVTRYTDNPIVGGRRGRGPCAEKWFRGVGADVGRQQAFRSFGGMNLHIDGVAEMGYGGS